MSDLQIPRRVSRYLIMTLNKKGPCTTYIDKYAQEFIQYASQQTAPVLELGAAYGFVSIAALNEGATVIANDLEPRHLDILYNQTPPEYRSRLTLLPGEFPQGVDLEAQSIAGCYIAHMLGYLAPSALQIGFEKLFTWLKNDAKLFIITSTPYKGISKKIIPLYEQRIREGHEWPGYFTDLKNLIGEKMPNTLHFFDEKILTRELEHAGFIIEQIESYARLDLPSKALWDSREGLMAIARKP
ncbi:class I SAM-dependent methyltransferase [Legionella fallonii]|uniref:BryB n=1 Tax=Legionella fallonii LLAP-10 TaxID=1212491 RepID=A0A098G1K6_9GAMM|nr:class I SAM-dependent methyltransferase [Legionella fallonii]CEG55859.1 BryB [Legionella fallonii LLAP-10]